MRSPLFVIVVLLACGHPAVVAPTPPVAPTTAPRKTSVPPTDPCAPELGPATTVLRAFRTELLAAATKDALGFQQSVPDRMAAFREKNRTVLAAHAAWSFKRLPKLALPGLDTLPDDPRVTADVAARMRGILAADQDKEGFSFQSFMGLLAADPIRAFAGIRGAVQSAVGSLGDLGRMRENMLEGLAPPRIVRLNDDGDHPVLAMARRADIFVVAFDHDAAEGAFLPKQIRWVRRDPPSEPSHDIKTAEDAFQSFAMAVEGSSPEDGLTAANLSARTLTQVGDLGKRWLDPHSSLLREHGACLCKQLPTVPMPDLADWKEEEGRWNLVLQTSMFPRLRWDPLQAFLFLRTTIDSRTMSVGDYGARALVDSLVQPTVFRGTDDLNDPVLFLVEGDTYLVVVFSSSPDRGYFPTQVRYFRRK